LYSRRHVSMTAWAWARLVNQCSLRHSSRKRPLKDSTYAFCVGSPGVISRSVRPRSCAQIRARRVPQGRRAHAYHGQGPTLAEPSRHHRQGADCSTRRGSGAIRRVGVLADQVRLVVAAARGPTRLEGRADVRRGQGASRGLRLATARRRGPGRESRERLLDSTGRVAKHYGRVLSRRWLIRSCETCVQWSASWRTRSRRNDVCTVARATSGVNLRKGECHACFACHGG
jgi:hypothetical protein